MTRWVLSILLAMIAAGSAGGDCVDINTATVEQLTRIVHIGEARASWVIRLRPHERVDDLLRVPGIGDKRLREIVEQGLASIDCGQADPRERMVGMVNCFGGRFDLGPEVCPRTGVAIDNGVAGWWGVRDGNAVRPVAELVRRLDEVYEVLGGHDGREVTVIINRIMGGGPGNVTGACVDTLLPSKRRAIETFLPMYLETRPNLRVVLFIGSSMTATDSLDGYVREEHGEYPGALTTFADDRAWEHVRGYWTKLGIRGFVFDYGATGWNRQWVIQRAQEHPELLIWGEAIPRDDRAEAGWMGLVRYVRNSAHLGIDYRVAPGETLGVWLNHEPEGTDYATLGRTMLDQGWHVIANAGILAEMLGEPRRTIAAPARSEGTALDAASASSGTWAIGDSTELAEYPAVIMGLNHGGESVLGAFVDGQLIFNDGRDAGRAEAAEEIALLQSQIAALLTRLETGDLTGDGRVGVADLLLLMSAWEGVTPDATQIEAAMEALR